MRCRKLITLAAVTTFSFSIGVALFAQNVLQTVHGAATDELGRSVSDVGDVNHDGYDDFIVGARYNRAEGSGWTLRVYSGQDGSVLYKRVSDVLGDGLGQAVSGVGDLNGDGYVDFAAGAPGADTGGADSGMIRVYSGLDGTVLYDWYGDAAGDGLGTSLSSAGDVNNDGCSDLIAGAPYNDAAGPYHGLVRVYSGLNGAVLYDRFGFFFLDRFGESVNGTGDVDGDGFDDFIVGASGPGPNYEGQVLVYSGLSGATLHVQQGGYIGNSVGGRFDVNADGFDDFIIGARGNNTNGSFAGMVRVCSGRTGAVLFERYGDNVADELGCSVDTLGDLNGDGHDDFVVGAHKYDTTATTAGLARVYSGQDATVLYNAYGDAQADYLGQVVSGVGDVNADGIFDIIAGVPLSDVNGTDSGMAKIITGPCTSIETYGVGCLGPADTHIPELQIETNCWRINQAARVSIQNAWGGGHAWLIVSLLEASTPWYSDCVFLVQSWVPLYLGTLDDAGPPPNGNGSAEIPFTIKFQPVPSGIYVQAVIVQPSTVIKNLTNGVKIGVP